MSLDFQQVRQQVIQMSQNAHERENQLHFKRELAKQLLSEWAGRVDELRARVERVARDFDPLVRAGAPLAERLDFCGPLPEGPAGVTLIAADGSQIFPDRNAPVDFSLINVGAVSMQPGSPQPPQIFRECQLIYENSLYASGTLITEARLALMRDFAERKKLAELGMASPAPVITFTDGPLELFMSTAGDHEDQNEFRKKQEEYVLVLEALHQRRIITAGYVDNPSADLLIRMLEIAATPDDRLEAIRDIRPLHGVRDTSLLAGLLQPGERSAVFSLQTRSARIYTDELRPCFFYLNSGRKSKPCISRVETPAWVVAQPEMLNGLHAALVHQCQIMGTRPFPYLLHRAHETAVVTLREKEEVIQMIVQEMGRHNVPVGDGSNKEAAKGLDTKKRYKR